MHCLPIQVKSDNIKEKELNLEQMFLPNNGTLSENLINESSFSPIIDHYVPYIENQSPITFPTTSISASEEQMDKTSVKFGLKKKPRILIPPVHPPHISAVSLQEPLVHKQYPPLFHKEPVSITPKPIIPTLPTVSLEDIQFIPEAQLPTVSKHVPVILEEPAPIIPVVPEEKPVNSEHVPFTPTVFPLKPKHHLKIPKLHTPILDITKLKLPKLEILKEHIPRAPIVHHNTAPVVHEEQHTPKIRLSKLHLPTLDLANVHLPGFHLSKVHLPELHSSGIKDLVFRKDHPIRPLSVNLVHKIKNRISNILEKESQ